MKKYFYNKHNSKIGSVTFDDFKKANISKNTLVWYDGMEDWKKAEQVDELKDILIRTC